MILRGYTGSPKYLLQRYKLTGFQSFWQRKFLKSFSSAMTAPLGESSSFGLRSNLTFASTESVCAKAISSSYRLKRLGVVLIP